MLQWSKINFQTGNKYNSIDYTLMPQDIYSLQSVQVFQKMLHWSKMSVQVGHKYFPIVYALKFWVDTWGFIP